MEIINIWLLQFILKRLQFAETRRFHVKVIIIPQIGVVCYGTEIGEVEGGVKME